MKLLKHPPPHPLFLNFSLALVFLFSTFFLSSFGSDPYENFFAYDDEYGE